MPSNFNLQLQRCGTGFAEPLVHATLKVVLETLQNGLQTRGRTICGLFDPKPQALWTKLPKRIASNSDRHGSTVSANFIFLSTNFTGESSQTRKSVTDTLSTLVGQQEEEEMVPLDHRTPPRRGARLGRWRSHDDDNLGNRSGVDSTLGSTNRLGRSRSPSIFCLGTMP